MSRLGRSWADRPVYNYMRDYDPAVGRYIESDPIGLEGGVNTYAYVMSSPTSWVDPWGLASLNLFDPNPRGHDSTGTYAGGNQWNIPGAYTVAGHGNPGNMTDAREGTFPIVVVWPEDLAKMIKNDPNWNHQPVTLGGCNTGDAWEPGWHGIAHPWPFAKSLANLLGVPVTAPVGFTRWTAKDGLLGTSQTNHGPISSPGNWKTFNPIVKHVSH